MARHMAEMPISYANHRRNSPPRRRFACGRGSQHGADGKHGNQHGSGRHSEETYSSRPSQQRRLKLGGCFGGAMRFGSWASSEMASALCTAHLRGKFGTGGATPFGVPFPPAQTEDRNPTAAPRLATPSSKCTLERHEGARLAASCRSQFSHSLVGDGPCGSSSGTSLLIVRPRPRSPRPEGRGATTIPYSMADEGNEDVFAGASPRYFCGGREQPRASQWWDAGTCACLVAHEERVRFASRHMSDRVQ